MRTMPTIGTSEKVWNSVHAIFRCSRRTPETVSNQHEPKQKEHRPDRPPKRLNDRAV
jgi:hypothetical protein